MKEIIKHLETLCEKLNNIESFVDFFSLKNYWDEGTTYHSYNPKTGDMSCSRIVTASCQCCGEIENFERNISELNLNLQIEIMEILAQEVDKRNNEIEKDLPF